MSNILIVDDDPEIRTIVSHHLKKAGYYVMTAESADEALDKELEVVPDLLILDKMMPGMDGFDFLEKLKSGTQASSIRVIMLTSCDRNEDIIEGLDTGADDYITKPFIPDVLLARVRSQLRTKALLDRLLRENESLKDKILKSSSD
ncbi:MAG: response regulator transcription factor [Candidatus Aminicenantes bacterium]|nr:response regulator transcription factor [Candidatus Aminicenantes bacterium]